MLNHFENANLFVKNKQCLFESIEFKIIYLHYIIFIGNNREKKEANKKAEQT